MTEGQALVEAQRELRDMEARAEKAEAALRDMEAARDEQTRMKMETCRALDKERDAAEAKIATARAVMAEEIARRFEELEPPTPRGYARQPVILVDDNEAAANFCRSLATLPAGLVVLSVEVVANARVELLEAHGRAERCECDKPCSTCGAIAALDAAGGETRHRNQPRACNCSWVLTGAHAQWCSTSDSNGGPR